MAEVPPRCTEHANRPCLIDGHDRIRPGAPISATGSPIIARATFLDAIGRDRVARSIGQDRAGAVLHLGGTLRGNVDGADDVGSELVGRSEAGAPGGDLEIRAVNAPGEVAERLGIEDGAACFLIEATGFIDGEVPLWREETYYRAEIFEFRNRLGGIADWRPAVGVMR